MKSMFRKTLLVAGLVTVGVFGATASFAHNHGGESCGPMGGGMMEGHGGHMGMHGDPAKMQARMDKHHAELKAKLKLQPNQEAAWATFTAAMKPNFDKADRPDPKKMREEMDKLTTPQRIDKMQGLMEKRQGEMKKRAEAVKTFYAQLNAEQQKTFDKEAMPRHGFGDRMKHRFDGEHRHGPEGRPEGAKPEGKPEAR